MSKILLLEKLLHLSKGLENKRVFELLEPWKFNGNDLIEVQKAGKKISSFIGLPNLTFIINYTKQEKNTAGHIELNNNSDEGVFIEIDEQFKSESDIILAILAHEICHKLIHVNNLTLFGYENEILTDTATIYAGLGKLSLNGCEVQYINSESKWNGLEKITTTTTTTKTVGYLKREQFAFLYNVVCNMRKIPNEFAKTGLKEEALNALLDNDYQHNEEIFINDYVHKKSFDFLHKFNHNYQIASAESLKLIKSLNVRIEELLAADKVVHNQIKSTNDKFIGKATENLKPERINYVKNLIIINELNEIKKLYEKETKDLIFFNKSIKYLFRKLNDRFDTNLKDRENLYKIDCPVCGNTMRLKKNILAKIKCTKCEYVYLIDNTFIDNENGNRNRKKSFMRKLKEIIAILKE